MHLCWAEQVECTNTKQDDHETFPCERDVVVMYCVLCLCEVQKQESCNHHREHCFDHVGESLLLLRHLLRFNATQCSRCACIHTKHFCTLRELHGLIAVKRMLRHFHDFLDWFPMLVLVVVQHEEPAAAERLLDHAWPMVERLCKPTLGFRASAHEGASST